MGRMQTTNTTITRKSTGRFRWLAQVGAGLTLSAAALGLASGVASAAPGATGSAPAAGISFQCDLGSVVFTTTGGTIHDVNQMHLDANGVMHFTGTISLQNVTASSTADGNTYSIVGASWYGGSGTSQQTTTVRSVDEFNIIGPQGKVASIHASVTINPDGTVSGHSFGDCAPPM
jgi:hypothetical protein